MKTEDAAQLVRAIEARQQYYSLELSNAVLVQDHLFERYCQGKISALKEMAILLDEVNLKYASFPERPPRMQVVNGAPNETETHPKPTYQVKTNHQWKTVSEDKFFNTPQGIETRILPPGQTRPKNKQAWKTTTDQANPEPVKYNKKGNLAGMTTDPETVARKVAAMNAARLKKKEAAATDQQPPIIQQHVGNTFSNPQFL